LNKEVSNKMKSMFVSVVWKKETTEKKVAFLLPPISGRIGDDEAARCRS